MTAGFGWLYYRRIRRHFGWQAWRPVRNGIRIGILSLVSAALVAAVLMRSRTCMVSLLSWLIAVGVSERLDQGPKGPADCPDSEDGARYCCAFCPVQLERWKA